MIRQLGCSALGCFGSIAVTLIALGVGWFGFVQPAIGNLTGQLDTTLNGSPSAPQPRAGSAEDLQAPLTRAELEKFVRIRREVRASMGGTFPQLQQIYADIQAGEPVNAWTAVQAVRALGTSVADARAALERGLVAENLSRERYAFVRQKVNLALGLPQVDLAGVLGELARSQGSGSLPDLSSKVTVATPEERAMVEKFSRELQVTAPLGVLGL
ncbi:hypothetical protein GCM10017783_06340 [Deinococcus piscis]|uniref:Uncharacterized protein n=1 Tax=Deinococcus piscis TaxID=394230 RepID=A0ABQ3K0H0_9DEIO|nr:hypothetical protein [Deinococcus piscis]GHF97244.1 hypothetical protein GCM10017783_06340 [Deinococcus piscis]